MPCLADAGGTEASRPSLITLNTVATTTFTRKIRCPTSRLSTTQYCPGGILTRASAVPETITTWSRRRSLLPRCALVPQQGFAQLETRNYILDRPSQLPLDGQHVSGGIFAPAISYNPHNKTFYMITTNVGWGNFFVKAKDPLGKWSELSACLKSAE